MTDDYGAKERKIAGQTAVVTGSSSGIGAGIARELGPKKIRVNSIAPGAIKTPINRAAWETAETEAGLLSLIPYKRIGEPVDIARVAVWLASDEADYVHGNSLVVDGGMTLYPGFATGG